MKKLTLVLILLLLIPHFTFSQTGWVKIYSDDTTVNSISKMYSFKSSNSNSKVVYIQKNSNGHIFKLNKTNNSWYIPSNNFLQPIYCFCMSCNPPTTYWLRAYSFLLSPLDSQLIIRNMPLGCGFESGESIDISYNNGATNTHLPQFSNDFIGSANFGYDFDPINDNIIYIGYPLFNQNYKCLFKSTNRGANWTAIDTNSNFSAGMLKVNPFNRTNIFIEGSQHLMISTNSGMDFINTDAPNLGNLVFDPVDSSIYGIRFTGIYKSTNHGFNWVQVANGYYRSIEISSLNHNILYAGSDLGLYRTDNGGQIWNLFNDSFTPSKMVLGLSMDQASGDTVYAATQDAVYKVWGMYVGIRNTSSTVPETFSLEQNYPNPFNPSTNIKFNIPAVGTGPRTVRLIIYDVLGKEVKTLVNEQLKPGSYEIDWNASNYPSGVYYYSLSAGDFRETKKMVLIK